MTSKVYTDEIFGPAISIKTFRTEDEVLQLANDTSYGLGGEYCEAIFPYIDRLTRIEATVYTSDVARALRVAGKLEAGTVGINSAFVTSPQTPFGGQYRLNQGMHIDG